MEKNRELKNIYIIGEDHSCPEDQEYKKKLKTLAENNQIIFISEGHPFIEDNIYKKNEWGIEDFFIFNYLNLLTAYSINMENQTDEDLPNSINRYIKAISYVLICGVNEYSDDDNNVTGPLGWVVSRVIKLLNDRPIFREFIEKYDCGEIRNSIKFDDWDSNQHYNNELQIWFSQNKSDWDSITKIISYSFISYIKESKVDLFYKDEKVFEKDFIEKLYNKGPTEIVNFYKDEILPVALDLRNRTYVNHFKIIAEEYKGNKPICFIVGDKHIVGLKELLEDKIDSYTISYFHKQNKPSELEFIYLKYSFSNEITNYNDKYKFFSDQKRDNFDIIKNEMGEIIKSINKIDDPEILNSIREKLKNIKKIAPITFEKKDKASRIIYIFIFKIKEYIELYNFINELNNDAPNAKCSK